MCTCATPRSGTGYRHNKMNCSDGSIAYCSVNDASEPFAYEELYDGCSSDPRTPGNSFVLEASILMKVLNIGLIRKNEKVISIFVGLTHKVNEGKWVWDSDGSETQYTFWDASQPNGGIEDCALMKSSSGKWHDGNCVEEEFFAICQKT